MLAAVGQVIDDPLEFAKRSVLGHIGDVDVVNRRQIDPVAVEGDAVHAGPARHGLRPLGATVAVLVAEQDHVAHAPAGGVESPCIGDREHPRVDEVAGEDLDLEALRGADRPGEFRVVRHLDLARLEHRRLDRGVGILADLALRLSEAGCGAKREAEGGGGQQRQAAGRHIGIQL